MAWDVFKPRGATKASQPDAGGAVIRSTPVLAIVKDNIDPIRAGRLQVYLADLGGNDPDNSDNWITVGYMSPFFGLTQPQGPTTGAGDYLKNSTSYGMWTSPPDIGTTVICLFINGDSNYGYYIGCVPEAETLYMVPAIGGSSNIIANAGEANNYGGATSLPVTNINTNDKGISNSSGFLASPRPVHSYMASVLSQQGLIRDPVRGVIGSSSQRESPSRVGYGISTPGRPIYEGGFTDEDLLTNLDKGDTQHKIISRRAGHTFVMDDGDNVGKDQLIRLRSTLGHQILMSDSGQTLFIIHANGQSWIELGKEGTIDMYATNSVNVRTQGDLNLHADNNLNIQAAKELNIAAETINMSSEKATTMKSGTDFSQYAQGKYTVKVTNGMSMASGGEASYSSDSSTYINGTRVNLNSGTASLTPQEVPPIPVVVHADTLFDASKGWAAAPGKLLSIVSRAPAHSPWSAAGQGVDVKIDNNAATALPSSPTAETLAVNNSVIGVQVPAVSTAIVSSVPSLNAISGALDKNATSAIVGQMSTLAASGPAADAIKAGMGVVDTAQGKLAVVGQLGLTPSDMEKAGILKQGSAALVNSLVQGGKTVEQAMTSNLFTGKAGAETLTNLGNNINGQVNAVVRNLRSAQTALTNTGLITGSESGTQIGGLLLSANSSGVDATVNFAKNAASGITGNVPGTEALNNVLGPVQNTLAAGNYATNLASTVTGGLSSLAGAIGGLGTATTNGLAGLANSAKGLAGAAFSKITSGFPTITAGVPQNLKTIVDNANALTGNANASGISSVAAAASGLNSIPGAEKVVASVVNNAKGAINAIPGAGAITSLLGNPGTALDKLKSGATSLAGIAGAGLPLGALAQLNSAISSLSSGGAVPIALAKIGINTDATRGVLGTTMQTVLGSSKIPVPGYAGNPATFGVTPATTARDDLLEKNRQQKVAVDAVTAQIKVVDAARVAYFNAKANLPDGDPERTRLLNEWSASLDKLKELQKAADALFE